MRFNFISVMKNLLKTLLMTAVIVSLSSCTEDGPGSVTSTSDLNGVWKTTDVSGQTPDPIDYLAVDGARWGMITNGDKHFYSQSTTIAGDGSGEFYLSNNGGTMYLEKYTGKELVMTHKGVTRTYKLDDNATSATIYNKTSTSYTMYVYEKDSNGDYLYFVDAGTILAGGWRGPLCVYTDTLYVAVYDYNGNFVTTYNWTELEKGVKYSLSFN